MGQGDVTARALTVADDWQVPELLALIDQYFGDIIVTPPEYQAYTSVCIHVQCCTPTEL